MAVVGCWYGRARITQRPNHPPPVNCQGLSYGSWNDRLVVFGKVSLLEAGSSQSGRGLLVLGVCLCLQAAATVSRSSGLSCLSDNHSERPAW